MVKAEHALKVGAKLGEGPLWRARENALYWLDIVNCAIHRWEPATGKRDTATFNQWVCALVSCDDGRLVGAVEDGLAFLDFATGTFEIIANPLPDRTMRFNDASADRLGRLWTGTMQRENQKPVASFYKLDRDLSLTEMDYGLSLSNGIGFSPDDSILYLSDSVQNSVFAYDFDLEHGTIANKRQLIWVDPKRDGYPDGLTVDAEGFIWLCHYDGWKVTRHAPDGKQVDSIDMPVPRPTSCMFGGANLTELYITSAIEDLSVEQLENAPMSGDVFVATLPVPGTPEFTFRPG
ncbi:SMP-30/gluconolactonase/LRE family protein [Candidatus Obscuribacterales bacterium]|nr:SMP-30/gluconolactonase/LRE family protein [Candidatus Obscuribacterales bacterium]